MENGLAAVCGLRKMTLSALFCGSGIHAQDARIASIILARSAGSTVFSQSAFWSVSSDIAGLSAGSCPA